MARNAEAFEYTLRAVLALGAELGDAEWDRPTECPGWTAKDIVSHLVGVERWMLGDPVPDHVPPDLPHLRDDVGRFLEIDVDLRRPRQGAEVLAELGTVLPRRLEQLAKTDPGEMTGKPLGRQMTQTNSLMFRTFDAWVHEQDIRRAVGRPGNLASPGGLIAGQILIGALPKTVAKLAAAGPGESAVFAVTGDQPFTVCAVVGADGRGSLGDEQREPTVRLEMDWEAFMRLSCGRCGPDDVTVRVTGDADLGERILGNMSVTP